MSSTHQEREEPPSIADDQVMPPERLPGRIEVKTRQALATGALQPLPTRWEHVEDAGVRFVVRVLARLAHKRQAGDARAPADPFLPPYDPDLYLGTLEPGHVCLLNKYNVVDRHILIVTRDYQPQESPLVYRDFLALSLAMSALPGLAFYNGGTEAGASQPHKHLQLIPPTLDPEGPAIPMEPLLVDTDQPAGARLPFVHAVSRRGLPLEDAPAAASEMLSRYRDLLRATGLTPEGGLLPPYNLLVTRDWMLVIPRARGGWAGLSVNALGFAGAMLVKDDQDLRRLRGYGPMRLLREVGLPAGSV